MPVTIPTIAESITANPDHNDGVGLEAFIESETKTPPAVREPEQKAEETKPPASTAPKALSESVTTLTDETPKPPEEKKVEVPTDEPREGEKPAQFIKRLKQERADLANELKQLRETSSKAKPADNAEVEALRSQLAERDKIIETRFYQDSPKFKEQYQKPLERAQSDTKALVAKFTETKGVYERALALDPTERAEYLTDAIGEARAAVVMMKLDQIDGLHAAREEALGNQAEISKAALAAQTQNESAEILKAFDGQREAMQKSLSPLRGEHAETYESQARALLTGDASPADIIAASRLAVICPHYIELCKSQAAKIALLEARIKEDGGDRPQINGRGAESGKAEGMLVDGKLPSVKSFLRQQVAGLNR